MKSEWSHSITSFNYDVLVCVVAILHAEVGDAAHVVPEKHQLSPNHREILINIVGGVGQDRIELLFGPDETRHDGVELH